LHACSTVIICHCHGRMTIGNLMTYGLHLPVIRALLQCLLPLPLPVHVQQQLYRTQNLIFACPCVTVTAG
jgi:hypothetical protein